VTQERRQGEFEELLPALREWNDGAGINIDDWITCVGSFDHAIGYARLFWPEFIEHDGCVFFADASGFDEAVYLSWMAHTNGDRRAVQAVMNHRHLMRLFGDVSLRPTRAQLRYLGRKLKDIWSAKLMRDFPGYQVAVTFADESLEQLDDYEITFVVEPPGGRTRG
jgi:hypothetical protein